jgi:DNA invertase Pin-like site-specific DNA recombinase
MKVGYARVSTEEQSALQIDDLRRAGCVKVYQEEAISGATIRRPALDRMLAETKPGDVLVTWRLGLGRSLPHLIGLVSTLK